MPHGGRLTIAVANVDLTDADARAHAGIAPGPYAELSVADSGVGIDPVVRARIFEPFFTTKGPGKGTGLGLSMVEGVVRQSGGDIWVDSEPGAGTTFRLYLPRLRSTGEVASGRIGNAPTPDPGGRELILLVEDEPGVREIARRILTGAGYAVLEARNPEAASQIIRERGADIDLLLTDVVMPGGTGPDVARMLAQVKPDASVLYMSGYPDDAISHRGVLEPDVTLIGKPFSAASLLAAVRSVLAAGPRGQAAARVRFRAAG
jgi:CheY-like chemotaxis protein